MLFEFTQIALSVVCVDEATFSHLRFSKLLQVFRALLLLLASIKRDGVGRKWLARLELLVSIKRDGVGVSSYILRNSLSKQEKK